MLCRILLDCDIPSAFTITLCFCTLWYSRQTHIFWTRCIRQRITPELLDLLTEPVYLP